MGFMKGHSFILYLRNGNIECLQHAYWCQQDVHTRSKALIIMLLSLHLRAFIYNLVSLLHRSHGEEKGI